MKVYILYHQESCSTWVFKHHPCYINELEKLLLKKTGDVREMLEYGFMDTLPKERKEMTSGIYRRKYQDWVRQLSFKDFCKFADLELKVMNVIE